MSLLSDTTPASTKASAPASAPASTLTRSQIVQSVSELAPRFRERTPATEQQRSVPRQSIDELVEAGVARMLVPAERGGLDLGFRDLIEVTAAAAYGCPSTGWLTGLMCATSHNFGLFPLEAQEAIWADGPDVIGAASIGLKATPVAGGYRVSGASPFSSGVNNATWVYIIGIVPAPTGAPEARLFLIPKRDYTIKDTWQTAGMRGTGSNTILTDDVFVPAAFTISHVDARDGTTPGSKINSNPSFTSPWAASGALTFAAAMLGAAEGAYDDVVAIMRKKRAPSGARTADSEYLQVQIAFAAARISIARTQLRKLADRADANPAYTVQERAEALRDVAFAAILLKEAVGLLVDVSGTSGFATSSFAQQALRDVNFAAAHQGLNARSWCGHFGRIALDVELQTSQLPLFY